MTAPENPMASTLTPQGSSDLRDWFAGKVAPLVLTQLWANLEARRQIVDNVYKVAAIASYEMADAMLAARSAKDDA